MHKTITEVNLTQIDNEVNGRGKEGVPWILITYAEKIGLMWGQILANELITLYRKEIKFNVFINRKKDRC